MGYAVVLGFCASCHQPMQFNPRLVPSLRIRGEKHPICQSCVERWKKLHPDQQFEIPKEAYEPADEHEL